MGRPRPSCTICGCCDEDRPATHLVATSHDAGRTVLWAVVCDGHAQGWNEGGDWQAPVYRLPEDLVDISEPPT